MQKRTTGEEHRKHRKYQENTEKENLFDKSVAFRLSFFCAFCAFSVFSALPLHGLQAPIAITQGNPKSGAARCFQSATCAVLICAPGKLMPLAMLNNVSPLSVASRACHRAVLRCGTSMKS